MDGGEGGGGGSSCEEDQASGTWNPGVMGGGASWAHRMQKPEQRAMDSNLVLVEVLGHIHAPGGILGTNQVKPNWKGTCSWETTLTGAQGLLPGAQWTL